MGVFDQAARYAAQAEPTAVLSNLLRPTGVLLSFRKWLDTRALPFPGGPDRTADLVAALDDPTSPASPWAMILEFQAQADPDKLDVTAEEALILRNHARPGPDRQDKFRVLTALVYLRGRCPRDMLDMTLPGFGTVHKALVWNVAEGSAVVALEEVAGGQGSWGLLYWVPLMAGSDEEVVIARWKELVGARVSDPRRQANLAGVALVFAELAGCVPAWKRILEGMVMTESQVVNDWIREAEMKTDLVRYRKNLIRLVQKRFAGAVPEEVVQVIDRQDSLPLLDEWFDAAIEAGSFEQFLAVLKR